MAHFSFGIYVPMLRKSFLQPSSGCKNILISVSCSSLIYE